MRFGKSRRAAAPLKPLTPIWEAQEMLVGPTAPSSVEEALSILRENRVVHLEMIESQRETLRYLQGFHQWLQRDTEERQSELNNVSEKVDSVKDGVDRIVDFFRFNSRRGSPRRRSQHTAEYNRSSENLPSSPTTYPIDRSPSHSELSYTTLSSEGSPSRPPLRESSQSRSTFEGDRHARVPNNPPPSPSSNDITALLMENRNAHLATIEQQREVVKYLRGLNQWLEVDVQDRYDQYDTVSNKIEDVDVDLQRLYSFLRDGHPQTQGRGY